MIDLAAGYITETVSRRNGDCLAGPLKGPEGRMRHAGREFDTPVLKDLVFVETGIV